MSKVARFLCLDVAIKNSRHVTEIVFAAILRLAWKPSNRAG